MRDATGLDFDSGDGVLAYLRSRALLAADAAHPAAYASIKVDEAFLVARRLPLGVLLDLAATFLDTLELHYGLYAAADGEILEGRGLCRCRRGRRHAEDRRRQTSAARAAISGGVE